MTDCDRYHPLIAGFADNELSDDEIIDLNRHLIKCGSCRREVENMKKTVSELEQLSFAEPNDEILAGLWRNPVTKALRISALAAVIGGWLILAGYSFYEFLANPDGPFIQKIALAAMVTGLVFLFLFVGYERFSTSKHDPYKEVQR